MPSNHMINAKYNQKKIIVKAQETKALEKKNKELEMKNSEL